MAYPRVSRGIRGKPIVIVGGTVGIKGTVETTATVTVTVGEIGTVRHLISGSVGITEMPSISGSVEIKGGTIDITGSVGIKQLPGVTGTVHISGGTVDATITVSDIGTVRHIEEIKGTVKTSIVGRDYETLHGVVGSVLAADSSKAYSVDTSNFNKQLVIVKDTQAGSIDIEISHDYSNWYPIQEDILVGPGTIVMRTTDLAKQYLKVKIAQGAVRGSYDLIICGLP